MVQMKARCNDEDGSNFPQEDNLALNASQSLSHQLVFHERSAESTALLARLSPLAEHPGGH